MLAFEVGVRISAAGPWILLWRPILPQELYVLAREDDEEGSVGPEDDSPLRDLAGFPLPELGDPGVATNGSEDSGGWETDQGGDGTDEVSCITLALMA